MIRHKKALWQRYLRSGGDDDFMVQRNYSNALGKVILDAKRKFESNWMPLPETPSTSSNTSGLL